MRYSLFFDLFERHVPWLLCLDGFALRCLLISLDLPLLLLLKAHLGRVVQSRIRRLLPFFLRSVISIQCWFQGELLLCLFEQSLLVLLALGEVLLHVSLELLRRALLESPRLALVDLWLESQLRVVLLVLQGLLLPLLGQLLPPLFLPLFKSLCLLADYVVRLNFFLIPNDKILARNLPGGSALLLLPRSRGAGSLTRPVPPLRPCLGPTKIMLSQRE